MSVSATSNPNGGTQSTQKFWAFGETQATTGTPVTRLKYTGREEDGTGLYQYRARYYDPSIGRFISEDPLKFQAGVNFYAYVGNDPLDANDPSGEIAGIDNLIGAGITAAVDLGAQYVQARIASKPFQVNWTRTAVAAGPGFITSGASAILGGGIEALGWGAGASFAARTTGNITIGAFTNVGATATVNKLEGGNDSLTSAALWGGGFGGLGSVVADAVPAFNAAINQAKISTLSPGMQNLFAGIGDLSGMKFGGTSPGATAGGVQLGNFVGSLTSFNPGDGSSTVGGTPYPSKPNNNQVQKVYLKP